jgi:hypothetical protein
MSENVKLLVKLLENIKPFWQIPTAHLHRPQQAWDLISLHWSQVKFASPFSEYIKAKLICISFEHTFVI